MEKLDYKDLVLMVPDVVVGAGEPGDPLNEDLKYLIRHMARMGYGVVDFGLSDRDIGAHELWFCKAAGEAQAMAEVFIELGGAV